MSDSDIELADGKGSGGDLPDFEIGQSNADSDSELAVDGADCSGAEDASDKPSGDQKAEEEAEMDMEQFYALEDKRIKESNKLRGLRGKQYCTTCHRLKRGHKCSGACPWNGRPDKRCNAMPNEQAHKRLHKDSYMAIKKAKVAAKRQAKVRSRDCFVANSFVQGAFKQLQQESKLDISDSEYTRNVLKDLSTQLLRLRANSWLDRPEPERDGRHG